MIVVVLLVAVAPTIGIFGPLRIALAAIFTVATIRDPCTSALTI